MAKKKNQKPTIDPEFLKRLLEAGCHFGHKSSRTHPKARPYIWQVRNGVAIFDLVKTAAALKQAQDFVAKLIADGGQLVFVGTKRQAREIVRTEAEAVGMPWVVNRWLGGTITNWAVIKQNCIDKLLKLKKDWEAGVWAKRPKGEQNKIRREIIRLEQLVGGLLQLKGWEKTALFLVDIRQEKTALREAQKKGVSVVAIVDSNCDPSLVDYPIPANDDAAKSIQLLVREITRVIKDSLKKEGSNGGQKSG